MPTASGLGFVDREHPPPRMMVRDTSTSLPPPTSIKYVPTRPERLSCCLLITTVVTAALATLSWFVATFEHS